MTRIISSLALLITMSAAASSPAAKLTEESVQQLIETKNAAINGHRPEELLKLHTPEAIVYIAFNSMMGIGDLKQGPTILNLWK